MSKLIALRLPNEMHAKLMELVKAGYYRNLSDAIRSVLKQFLEGVKHE